jgi:hypothetical protein
VQRTFDNQRPPRPSAEPVEGRRGSRRKSEGQRAFGRSLGGRKERASRKEAEVEPLSFSRLFVDEHADGGGGTMTWDSRRQALLFLGGAGTYALSSSHWERLAVGTPACAGALAGRRAGPERAARGAA